MSKLIKLGIPQYTVNLNRIDRQWGIFKFPKSVQFGYWSSCFWQEVSIDFLTTKETDNAYKLLTTHQ